MWLKAEPQSYLDCVSQKTPKHTSLVSVHAQAVASVEEAETDTCAYIL